VTFMSEASEKTKISFFFHNFSIVQVFPTPIGGSGGGGKVNFEKRRFEGGEKEPISREKNRLWRGCGWVVVVGGTAKVENERL